MCTLLSQSSFTQHSFWKSPTLWCVAVHSLLLCCQSVAESCPTLCNPMNCSTPGLPCPSPSPGVCSNSCQTQVKHLACNCMTSVKGEHLREWFFLKLFVLGFLLFLLFITQSYPTLWDPMDCSTPGLPVHHQLPELAPWKRSCDQPRQHIKKQRHYFADKGPSSQSYGFSSSHV